MNCMEDGIECVFLSKFLNWAEKGGVVIDKIEIKESLECRGMGVFAKEDIVKNYEALVVPKSMLLFAKTENTCNFGKNFNVLDVFIRFYSVFTIFNRKISSKYHSSSLCKF